MVCIRSHVSCYFPNHRNEQNRCVFPIPIFLQVVLVMLRLFPLVLLTPLTLYQIHFSITLVCCLEQFAYSSDSSQTSFVIHDLFSICAHWP